MSEVGERIADHARALIGTRFRLHGRDCATGLDCVGVVLACLEAAGRPLSFPAAYGLRNADIAPWLALVEGIEVPCATRPPLGGDILLVRPGPAQHHLLVALGSHSFVHAHASLRRVVETPFPAPWPLLRHWRLT
ncbi:peptidoglycan endopeptidase [Parerythrobacter aurantius]|uniref:peptidoglycan endopeptidase n=1 Tax=Parerythrobacter aurantius TaxID=3127706 RepID=UPI003248C7B6